jgi:hypothetical protein
VRQNTKNTNLAIQLRIRPACGTSSWAEEICDSEQRAKYCCGKPQEHDERLSGFILLFLNHESDSTAAKNEGVV